MVEMRYQGCKGRVMVVAEAVNGSHGQNTRNGMMEEAIQNACRSNFRHHVTIPFGFFRLSQLDG